MLRKYIIALTVVLSLLALQPAAAVEGGFYLGAGLGGATTEVKEGSVSFDENDFAWKAFGGFHFLQFFAVEASYRDLGAPTTTIGNDEVKVDTTAYDLSGLVGLPLGPIFLFGKLGVVSWDSDITVSNTVGKISDDGTDYLIGIGGSLDISKVRLRAELEYLDIQDGSLMYTLGAAWLF